MDYYEQMQTEAMTKGMAESSNKNLKDLLKLQSDLRKLVVKWETPYEHFDEDYDIPNRFTCADDVKQLLDGGE